MSKKVEMIQKTQRRKKIHALERFGGKCSICGYDKCISALEFHHIENKKESPSYIITRWSWDRVKQELDKCILVCANCHREIHYSEKDIDYEVFRKKWISKICPQCNETYETKDQDQVYCSQFCFHISKQKASRPSREELEKLIHEKVPFVKLGKIFGVSDNAVRKWAKSYGII